MRVANLVERKRLKSLLRIERGELRRVMKSPEPWAGSGLELGGWVWGLALFREVSRCRDLRRSGLVEVVARSLGHVEVVARSWGSLWVLILCVCVGRLAACASSGCGVTLGGRCLPAPLPGLS